MNPFEAHAASLSQLQRETASDTGNQAGGTITYNGATFPANVGPFTIQGMLTKGGYSPSLIGTVTINKKDFPNATPFHSGNRLGVTAPLSAARACQIIMIEDCYSFWVLTVADVSQNAG